MSVKDDIKNFKEIISSISYLRENGIDIKVDKENLKEQFEDIKANDLINEVAKMSNEPSNLYEYLKKVYKNPNDFKSLTMENVEKAKKSNKFINKEWIGYTKEWFGQNKDDDKVFTSKIKFMEKLQCVKIWHDGGGTELGLDIKSNRVYCFDHDYGFINNSMSLKKALSLNTTSTNESTILSEDAEDAIPATDNSVNQPATNNNISMLVVLNSLLRVYCSNFSVLHWNSVGEEFNDAHRNIAEEYEALCHKYVDSTAEMATRLGTNPLNYVEVIVLMNSCDKKYLVVDSKRLYTRKDIIIISNQMLSDIVELINATIESEELQVPINAGIRSELESILNDFDLQYRYINNRRLSNENNIQ